MHSSEQQLKLDRLLVENSLGLMCIHDLKGELVMVNSAAAESLGYSCESVVGRSICEFLDPSVQPLFGEYLQRICSLGVDSGMMRLRSSNGEERIWLYRNVRHEEPGMPPLVLGHALDITERLAAEKALKQSQMELARAQAELERRVEERTAELQQANQRLQSEIEQRRKIEEELLRARKLEALGGLAGGIAHDFNNLMTIVIGYCGALRAALADRPGLYEQVAQIHKAAEQANSLTRQLLAFSRRQTLQPTLLNLNEVLSEMGKMLHRLISDDIELAIMTDCAVGVIHADRGQIEQVIMNLVINAADAMPRGGKLTLATANITREDESVPDDSSRPQSYVRLIVRDTGVGMDPEVQARIFDPFFTTKEPGKGTGLGLATVYGIVTQAGGRIGVKSEPRKGTIFELDFPQVGESAPGQIRPEPPIEWATPGTETILLADDQEGLRNLLCEILRNNGYQVLPARNGEEALRLAGEHPGEIDLVITDMVMPLMGGRELAEALPSARPQTKVLYISGCANRAEDVSEVLSLGHAFLEKPFTPATLLQKVREVLDAPATHRAGWKPSIRRTG